MDESILNSVKKLLGLTEEYTPFDADVVMYVNAVFAILCQMGVGPENGFSISGSEETWGQFLSDPVQAAAAKAYTAAKVRLMGFDIPQSSTVNEALKNTISELEWRLYADNEYGEAKSS